MAKPTEFVNAQFPAPLARQARVEAAKQGVSRSELIRKAVEAYLGSGEDGAERYSQNERAERPADAPARL